ncbi:hypothetical protein ACFQ1L_01060 [Phytohabitans flavus]|uniref:hypothetical protein n=1 Tax=Phytohabitans flavus TaxID=1076124 RepID=UPI00362C8BFF
MQVLVAGQVAAHHDHVQRLVVHAREVGDRPLPAVHDPEGELAGQASGERGGLGHQRVPTRADLQAARGGPAPATGRVGVRAGARRVGLVGGGGRRCDGRGRSGHVSAGQPAEPEAAEDGDHQPGDDEGDAAVVHAYKYRGSM